MRMGTLGRELALLLTYAVLLCGYGLLLMSVHYGRLSECGSSEVALFIGFILMSSLNTEFSHVCHWEHRNTARR